MNAMKQDAMEIRLRELMERDDGWGHKEGRQVFQALLKIVESKAGHRVFRISLKGVKKVDASFPRESVVELAKKFRGEKGFCLYQLEDQDMLDNWDAAALKKEQPLLVWEDERFQLIGPAPSAGTKEMLEYALKTDALTAAVAAKDLGLKIANASMKLKQLEQQGFLLRSEDASITGGKEFYYYRIK